MLVQKFLIRRKAEEILLIFCPSSNVHTVIRALKLGFTDSLFSNGIKMWVALHCTNFFVPWEIHLSDCLKRGGASGASHS